MNSVNTLSYRSLESPPLAMTDYWFLFGMWVVIFWAVDPFSGYMDLIPVIKHFPIFVIAPAFCLAFLGRKLFKHRASEQSHDSESKRIIFAIAAFGIFVFLGSAFGRWVNGVENTFLTMGLFALTALATYWFITQSSNPEKLVTRLLHVYLFWALIAVAVQAYKYGAKDVFHSKEHLVLGSMTAFFFFSKSNISRFLSVLAITGAAYVAHKNTAYLTVALFFIAALCIWAIPYSARYKVRLQRWAFWGAMVCFLAISGAVLYTAKNYNSSGLPSGNTEYRLRTYENAWNKFLSSPLYGSGFTGAATEKFDLYTVASTTQVLPTHSDPLDIMAQGGIVGISLWAGIFVLLAQSWLRLISNRHSRARLRPLLHTYFFMAFSGVMVCAFNPILNTPNLAWAYWATIGALIALRKQNNLNEQVS